MNIRLNFDKDIEKLMISRGLDKLVLANKRTSFDLADAITPFKPSVDGVKTRPFSHKKQFDTCLRLLDHPLRGSGVYVINSFPTDLRAKLFAAQLMAKACTDHRDQNAQQRRGCTSPLWVRVNGFNDFNQMALIKEQKPCLIIFSNITESATPQKVERLRDLIDNFDTVPRIVATTGSDPITFMMRRIQYPLAGAIRLGPNEKINILDM